LQKEINGRIDELPCQKMTILKIGNEFSKQIVPMRINVE
jgi:hypothetical protein